MRPIAGYRHGAIAVLAAASIAASLAIAHIPAAARPWLGVPASRWPLDVALVVGGVPLVFDLLRKVVRREFGADLLAGIAIITAVLLDQHLAGTLVVLMLSGGEALEHYAVRNASSALVALARRMPTVAHRRRDGAIADIGLDEVAVGDVLIVQPHEICPVDGTVVQGHGAMDEAYLTGEPYVISKAPGAAVISGAINGASALMIRADRLAVDSRYAKIMHVMRESEQRRPRLRRLGDQLGAYYTPLAVMVAVAAWAASGDPVRFLAVLVIATPCPLLIAIPVAIIGSVSLAARRGIIVKDPAALERLDSCRIVIFDKTGTLTYGRPELTAILPAPGFESNEVLSLVASLELYSKHPLAVAILNRAGLQKLSLAEAAEVREEPGEGLTGVVKDRRLLVTNRGRVITASPQGAVELPPVSSGMECVVLVDGRYAATFQFRDEPRGDSPPFIRHLGLRHRVGRVLLVSGDREAQVRYLANTVGITEVHAGQTPEQKLALVRNETRRASTMFVGDGINDAPALTAATVGVAFGRSNDVTSEAAAVVILDNSLRKVDELLHISHRMRVVALQSAMGGMALSVAGMAVAAAGGLPPVAGAVAQEGIDLLAVLNALRAAWPPKALTDY